MSSFFPGQVSGQAINLWQTNTQTGSASQSGGASGSQQNFGQMLLDGLNQVNDLQHKHDNLIIKAITDPKSVNAHDITIAQAEASMALSITKDVVDRVIRAYQNILSVR